MIATQKLKGKKAAVEEKVGGEEIYVEPLTSPK